MKRGYSDSLARIHDAGFGDFAAAALPFLTRLLRQHGIRSGHIVELGCGPGRTAAALVRQGHRVLGIDVSAPMIRLARRNAPGAVFRHASLFASPLPPCDAVIAIGECMNYAFGATPDVRALRRLIRTVRDAVRPGGFWMFDVRIAVPGFEEVRETRRDTAAWVVLSRSRESGTRRRLQREITTFVRAGRTYRRFDETHELVLWPAATLVTELRRAGFAVRMLPGYGTAPLPDRQVLVVAERVTRRD